MKPDTTEKLLIWILRTAGAVCALAIVPMLMPTAWAQAAHAAIGLGELPGEPIVMHLVRGMSAMCALYGGLLLLLAGDVHRYRRVITFQAVAILPVATCPFSETTFSSTVPFAGYTASRPFGCKPS